MWWRAAVVSFSVVFGAVASAWAVEPVVLDVRTDPSGGVRAVATVWLPAPVPVVRELLTDYAHWPELFDVRMRVASLTIQNGVALTDVRIEHALMPGEIRLVTESRQVSEQEFLSTLKGGDFTRYHRRWVLTPVDGGHATKGEFELVVQIDTVMPDWLVASATKRDLESHFRILREKSLARVTPGT